MENFSKGKCARASPMSISTGIGETRFAPAGMTGEFDVGVFGELMEAR
jgi:hypothetical protein